MKKQITIYATILLFFCASPPSFAQSSIIGYSPPFVFNTITGQTIIAYSDLFVFNTQLEMNRIVVYSNYFTFNTLTEEDRIIVYSGFFTFDTRVGDGRLIGYSDLFSFNTLVQASLIAYSDLFIFNTLPAEYLITVDISPADGGSVTGAGSFEPDTEVTLEATANEGYAFLNWTDENDAQVSDEAVYTFTMPAENITLTANFQYVVGIGDLAGFELVIYPNPANSKFFVESDRTINRIILIDAAGQIVRSVDVDELATEIDISTLRSGVYFMQLHLSDNIVTRRVQVFR